MAFSVSMLSDLGLAPTFKGGVVQESMSTCPPARVHLHESTCTSQPARVHLHKFISTSSPPRGVSVKKDCSSGARESRSLMFGMKYYLVFFISIKINKTRNFYRCCIYCFLAYCHNLIRNMIAFCCMDW